MKPSMTIVQYLYSGCNTWLRHGDDCDCSAKEKIQDTLDQIHVEVYMEIEFAKDYAGIRLKEKSAEEWDEICGPKAEDRVLNDTINAHMSQVTELIALQATKERMRSE